MIGEAGPYEVEAAGTLTRYWEYGLPTGTPLILVHGFRGDHHGLIGVAEGLSRHAPAIRTIVPDLPGFGRTPRLQSTHDLAGFSSWLREFAHAVAPEGHDILGHSFGSLVVSAAIADGLAPRRTILINPIASPALEGPQAVLTKLATLYYRAGQVLPERGARMLLGNTLLVRLMSEVMAKTSDRALRSWIHDQHRSHFSDFTDAGSLLQAFQASISHTVIDYAPAFTMPTMLIAGEIDDITPLARQLDLHHHIVHSTLRIMPNVGHLVHYEAVSDAAEEIASFLAATSGE